MNFQSLKEYVESKEFRSVMTGPESEKRKKKVCEMLREFSDHFSVLGTLCYNYLDFKLNLLQNCFLLRTKKS